jgi:hypothetical protein
MKMKALLWVTLFLFPSASWATSISITGSLNSEEANDVLLVSFTLSSATPLTIQSFGYGGTSDAPGGVNAAGNVISSGGFDTYFSLFSGTGPAATFLASSDDGLCPPAAFAPACRDSQLDFVSIGAGEYTLALSVFDNFSFAENFGSGTLGDGFIGLGSYFNADSNSFRTPQYAVDFTANDLIVTDVTETIPAIPEPATAVLLGSGMAIAYWKQFLSRSSRS